MENILLGFICIRHKKIYFRLPLSHSRRYILLQGQFLLGPKEWGDGPGQSES